MINLEKFFEPKSVAVVGASSDPKKVGYALISNLLKNPDLKIYPVTLSEKEILGRPAVPSVLEIGEPIDLAIIAVRADVVPNILVECGQKDVHNAIVISSGFKETGEAGRELEELIAKIAHEQNITLLGPNCLGIINTKGKVNASFSGKDPLPGRLAFLSQSGALGTAVIDLMLGEGLGLSKFISLGNEAALTEIEFLEYLENDPETSAILMYIENINDGPKFFETVKRITPKKPVVIIKAGMGSHGNLAVKSHTGALAPQASVFVAACRQAGAATVSSLRGFFNIVKVLSQTDEMKIPLQRLVILTNGGGPSVIAADLIDRSKSLSLIALREETKESLRKVLPPMAAVGNPVDIIGDALAERYDKAMEILCGLEDVQGLLVILTPQMMTEAEATAKVLAKYKDRKKIFPIFIGWPSIQPGRDELIKSGLTHFSFPRDVIDALDYLAKGAPKPHAAPSSGEKSAETSDKMINFGEAFSLLSQYSIPVSGQLVINREGVSQIPQSFGAGLYAMKVLSGSIIHKTEAGAVKLNVPEHELLPAWEEMERKFGGLEGVLIQPMAGGREVIIGMKRDKTFGPAIVFGLGGIFAEALKDTVMRIAPLDREEALKMMQEIKGIKILQGLRGQAPVNFDMLADIILNLSKLSLEHPEIKEIDLNPVMATESSATVVDARVMI